MLWTTQVGYYQEQSIPAVGVVYHNRGGTVEAPLQVNKHAYARFLGCIGCCYKRMPRYFILEVSRLG
jgi:hypothetical protein